MLKNVACGVIFCCVELVASTTVVPFDEAARQVFQSKFDAISEPYLKSIASFRSEGRLVKDEDIGLCIQIFSGHLAALVENNQKGYNAKIPPLFWQDKLNAVVRNFQWKMATSPDGKAIPEEAQDVMRLFLQSENGREFLKAIGEPLRKYCEEQNYIRPLKDR